MSIYGISGGSVVRLAPRVKHNGVIKTPVSVWTKLNGELKHVWPEGPIPTHGENAYCRWINPVDVLDSFVGLYYLQVNLTDKTTGALMPVGNVILSDAYFYPKGDRTAEDYIVGYAVWNTSGTTDTMMIQVPLPGDAPDKFPYVGYVPFATMISGQSVTGEIQVTITYQ